MDNDEKGAIAELKTHVLYIRENMSGVYDEIKEVNNKLNNLPCNSHSKRLGEVEDCIKDIKNEKKEQSSWSKKKTIVVIGGLVSIISAVISAVISKIV